MQCSEFEIISRWIAARLRRSGFDVVEQDPDFAHAVSALELSSVAAAVGLGDGAISSVAQRLGCERSQAA